ncbi:FAD-dependent oxidoreductase [uncultured Adlercreutzia sp.]|uniref:FAD-dependent oxidoreductase n=1 Tax=uncultured Adlercreutzia sp. TaxID=875803 RepID=UPI0025F6C1D3|nr:FAD-dependent oxidoreductase [uncultured Adlercreutzia sp.]
MTENMERRDFLKASTLLGAAALGATALAGCAPQTKGSSGGAGSLASTGGADPSSIDWTYETDVVIIGSGSGGTCAAIEAARAGADVIIFEKDRALFGGDSALCGGYMLAANWSTQEELTGYAGDTGEAFADQMIRWAQGCANEEMIREACMRSGEAVDWMIETGRVYEGASPLAPVWSCGDTEADIVPRSVYNHSAYGAEAGHMATLRKIVEETDNIQVEMDAEVAHIIKSASGEVIGVQLASGDYAKARKGVVIACASVDNNAEMARDLGLMQDVWGMTLANAGLANPGSPDVDSNTGDGIRMLREIGADLLMQQAVCMNDDMYVGGVSDWGYSDLINKEINIYESTNLDAILVDKTGRRFCQDDAIWGYVIHECSNAAWRQGFNPNDPKTGYIYYIYDASGAPLFELKGHTPDQNETTYTADTVEGLAEFIGCNPKILANEVSKWNAYCEGGEDLDFGRRANLAPIVTPPFYADVVKPGPMGTFAGAKSNVEAEIIGLDGNPIPRLYGAGCIIGGNYSGPFYVGCGWSITNTVVWGREAGQNVAALESWEA